MLLVIVTTSDPPSGAPALRCVPRGSCRVRIVNHPSFLVREGDQGKREVGMIMAFIETQAL